MVLNQNVTNCILVSLIIVIAVHYLFNNRTKKTPKRVITVNSSTEPFSKDVNNTLPVSTPSVYPDVSSINHLPYNEEASLEYITKLLTGPEVSQGAGPIKPAKSRKQFNDDFFGFRDTTNNNTSIRYDAVDKIQQLYLEGNTSDVRGHKSMKIKDLYDDLTKGPNLYLRQCVRLPEYDNLGDDGYTTSPGLHPTSASMGGWNYPNEKSINGGAIVPGLHGSDPYANFNMPV
jgi:hypothetical protein